MYNNKCCTYTGIGMACSIGQMQNCRFTYKPSFETL